MTEMVSPASTPAVPQKKGWGIWKWLLVAAGVVAAILLTIGVMVMQAYNWVKNSPEPSIAVFQKLVPSPGEEEDVKRIWNGIQKADHQNTIFEDYASPTVFNVIVERMIEEDRKKGKIPKEDQIFARLAFEPDVSHLRVSFPAYDIESKQKLPGMYQNLEVWLNLEVEDAVMKTLDVKKVLLKGKEPPFFARKLLQDEVEKIKRESIAKKDTSDLRMFKLLKREGDRVHFIIDGNKN